jgi:Flp pilus assembly protein TadG
MSRHERFRGDPGRLHGDEGTVLIEALMVIPILITMLAGVMDFGVGMRDRQIIQGASRNGVRVAAASANYGGLAASDQAALTALWAGISSVQSISVQRVVIFKANPTTWSSQASDALKEPPTACLTATLVATGTGVTGSCNVYSGAQAQAAATSFVTAGAACSTSTGYDRFWCPATRKTGLTDNSGRGPDYIGMYVLIRYTTFTGFLVKTVDMADTTIVRLEPRS